MVVDGETYKRKMVDSFIGLKVDGWVYIGGLPHDQTVKLNKHIEGFNGE